MKVENNNLSFCHLIPTKAFLRSAVRIHDFEDAKLLNYSVNVKYSGWISFYKRAIKIADGILQNNPELKPAVEKIKQAINVKQKNMLINDFVNKHGENIDVKI